MLTATQAGEPRQAVLAETFFPNQEQPKSITFKPDAARPPLQTRLQPKMMQKVSSFLGKWVKQCLHFTGAAQEFTHQRQGHILSTLKCSAITKHSSDNKVSYLKWVLFAKEQRFAF